MGEGANVRKVYTGTRKRMGLRQVARKEALMVTEHSVAMFENKDAECTSGETLPGKNVSEERDMKNCYGS